jgi:putative ABC transport system permease protein
METFKLILESFRFAWSALRTNLLRTILSLLGVTVGIFSIITVFTLIDSLEDNIKESLSFLGSDILYVTRQPFTPEADGVYRWWEYINRPNPSYFEYKVLEDNLQHASAISIFANRGGMLVKSGNSSVSDVSLSGVSYSHYETSEYKIEEGRYFTPSEAEAGRNVVIVGNKVATDLFGAAPMALGKVIKIKNQKYQIIGVLEFEGESLIGPSQDNVAIIPYNSFRKLYQTGTGSSRELGSFIVLKGMESDEGFIELENEVIGILRNLRTLRPSEKENFAINRPEAIGKIIDSIFNVLGFAGAVIGGFAILIGGFGIANIMFVSVKERTSIIGLQKSLGAKNYFILFQFLFESVFLSLIGGLAGLFLVYLITFIPLGNLEVTLSFRNILIGLGVSSAIGMVSGIIPALNAARLDPVIAIRA